MPVSFESRNVFTAAWGRRVSESASFLHLLAVLVYTRCLFEEVERTFFAFMY